MSAEATQATGPAPGTLSERAQEFFGGLISDAQERLERLGERREAAGENQRRYGLTAIGSAVASGLGVAAVAAFAPAAAAAAGAGAIALAPVAVPIIAAVGTAGMLYGAYRYARASLEIRSIDERVENEIERFGTDPREIDTANIGRAFDGRAPDVRTAGGETTHEVLGVLHRADGPAVEREDGSYEWHRHGLLHRDDGPAVRTASGTERWYRDGVMHREDGPAETTTDGTERWYRDGTKHRDDGPAEIHRPGRIKWYVDGEQVATYSSGKITYRGEDGRWRTPTEQSRETLEKTAPADLDVDKMDAVGSRFGRAQRRAQDAARARTTKTEERGEQSAGRPGKSARDELEAVREQRRHIERMVRGSGTNAGRTASPATGATSRSDAAKLARAFRPKPTPSAKEVPGKAIPERASAGAGIER